MNGHHTVTRFHDISCGHRVVGHEGKCVGLHGHNYRIHFTVAMTPQFDPARLDDVDLDRVGRVIDFSVIKTKLCDWLERVWDHKLLLWCDDPFVQSMTALHKESVCVVPFNPTAENIARY